MYLERRQARDFQLVQCSHRQLKSFYLRVRVSTLKWA